MYDRSGAKLIAIKCGEFLMYALYYEFSKFSIRKTRNCATRQLILFFDKHMFNLHDIENSKYIMYMLIWFSRVIKE